MTSLGRSALLRKLLAIHLSATLLALGTVWVVFDTRAAAYFTSLMRKYNVAPADVHAMFLQAVHRYLVIASLGAVVSAVAFGFWLTRRVIGPLARMVDAAGEIAAGDFSVRVDASSGDDVGRLAWAFDEMAASLARSDQLRRQIVVDLAHELRGPITNMGGLLEGIDDGVLPASRATFDSFREETRRLSRLVEDLLELARAEAASRSARLEPVALSRVLGGMLGPLRPVFTSRGIGIDDRIAGFGGFVLADADLLARVLRSLLDNAALYTPPGGVLTITMVERAGTLRVVFANPGVIPEKDLPRIFDRFYRVRTAGPTRSAGAGIGLAIVDQLIRAQNGTVGAESSSGEVRIWFELPRVSLPNP